MLSGQLIEAAWAAARKIEGGGSSYSAAQTTYGLEVEALVAEEWIRASELEDGVEVEAVRLFDCDGERGAECRTLEEIAADLAVWTG